MNLVKFDQQKQFHCTYLGTCSGCTSTPLHYSHSIGRKKEQFLQTFKRYTGLDLPKAPLVITPVTAKGLRHHADLTLHRVNGERRIGLYNTDRSEILDLKTCPLMSKDLEAWYQEVRSLLPSIDFGHFRIRVSPNGEKGIWLDFPNHVLDYFFKEKRLFRRFLSKGTLEIGQRHLEVIETKGNLECLASRLNAWSQTWNPNTNTPMPLFSTLASFSQPGPRSNRLLIDLLYNLMKPFDSLDEWVELGSGTGNLTYPLTTMGRPVTAVEMHPESIRCLKYNLKTWGKTDMVTIVKTNFHQASSKFMSVFKPSQGLLVDPPRSGLGSMVPKLASLPPNTRPRCFIYVSCFAQSLAKDASGILNMGYELQSIQGLDQFPNSSHCEWLACFIQK